MPDGKAYAAFLEFITNNLRTMLTYKREERFTEEYPGKENLFMTYALSGLILSAVVLAVQIVNYKSAK